MNKKVLATAMVVLGLFPSLLFAQLYRMDVDVQKAGEQKVIDRVFTGNTIGLRVSFYDGADALSVTNWTMRFMYGYGKYDTNSMVPIVGTTGDSSNVVLFQSTTNVFFSENENYYFSIVGTNATAVKTFARGRMIEEYDPATGGAGGYPLPMPWGLYSFATHDWVAEYVRTNEFEVVVGYGTDSNTAYRGDWGHSVSGRVDSVSNIARTAQTAATNAQGVASNAAAVAAEALPAADAATNYVPRFLSGWWHFGGSGLVTIYTNLTVNGTFKVRQSRVLRESTLTDSLWKSVTGPPYIDPGLSTPFTLSSNAVSPRTNSNGHARMVIATTNAEHSSSGIIKLIVDGETISQFAPACDGSYQTNDYPFVTSNMTVELALEAVPNPLSNSAPIITSLKFWTLADPTQATETFIDTKDQRIGGDDATLPRQWVNKQTMEASDDAVFDLLFAEVEDRTTATDYHGEPVTWNPRYTQTTASNSIVHKYSGQTYMRVDGEGAAVTPEIKAFSVASGEIATMTVWSYSGGASNLLPEYCTDLVAAVWTRLSNSVVSATNVDDYTAQVVFTNSLDRMAFFRLVDTSGGTGVPVVNFYGAVGINGDVQTAWPAGGEGSGISAATATSIAQRVIGAAPASAFSNVTFGATATVMCATGTWYDAATRTAYTTSCPSGTGGGAANTTGEETAQTITLSDGYVTLWSTGRWVQSYAAVGAATIRVQKAVATNAGAILFYMSLGTNSTTFATNNVFSWTGTGILTNGGTNLVRLDSPPGSSNWYWGLVR